MIPTDIPLWQERARVRGLSPNHPHPILPHQGGGELFGIHGLWVTNPFPI